MAQQQLSDPFECLSPTTLAMQGSGGGALSGLSFVAKDLFAVEGHTPSFGHPAWRATHAASPTTAPAIRDLLDAGADLVGLTKLDQLAYSLIGDVGEGSPPLNPTDSSLYCGGSSSGSAAAVAGDMADFALGTDTAGSVRVPAAVCGVLGIRPTHGSIPSDGILPLAPSFDVAGLFAKTVVTLGRALAVVAPGLDGPRPPVSIRIAADTFAMVDRESALLGRQVAEQLASLTGTTLEDVAFESLTDGETGDLFARLQGREIWDHHSEWVEANGHALADDVRLRLERCKQLSRDPHAVRLADLAGRREFSDRLSEAVPSGAVVVLPILPRRGPERVWTARELVEFRTECFRLTAPASLAGAPQAIWSVEGEARRSVGIGLLTAPGDDTLLLDVMALLSEESAEVGD